MIRKLLCISALLVVPTSGCLMEEEAPDTLNTDVSNLGADACAREICFELDANADGQLDQLDLVKILQDCTAENTVDCVPLVTGSNSGQQTLVLALSRGLDPSSGPHVCATQPSCDHWPLMFAEPADLEAHTADVAEDDAAAYASEASGHINLKKVTLADRPVVSASGMVFAAEDIPAEGLSYLRLFDDVAMTRKRMLEAYARLNALNWGSEAHRYLAEAYFDNPLAEQQLTAAALTLIQGGGCVAECTVYSFPGDPAKDDAEVEPQPFQEQVKGEYVANCSGAITDGATPHEVIAECPSYWANQGNLTQWPFAYAMSKTEAKAEVKLQCAFLGDCSNHGCTAEGWYEADFVHFEAEAHVDDVGVSAAGVSGTAPVGRLVAVGSEIPKVTVSAKAETGYGSCWGEYNISEECVLTVGGEWSLGDGFPFSASLGAECG
ncbi:MAG: hypothetical protein JRI68_32160, partial [Deltaproteobacteria bacterium]|nr:hypothetical protein [Deltaproteobacteria bacterium]